MIEPDYRHVLFKDLKPYLNRFDYLKGFTTTEQAYIRKNIGAISKDDIVAVTNEAIAVTHSELINLIENSELSVGTIYVITDYQTIYQSNLRGLDGKYITFGGDVNPSETYMLIAIAATTNALFSNVTLVGNNKASILWTVKYDPTIEILEDGKKTKGKIFYMQDENMNQACFDFKNTLVVYNSSFYHTFSDNQGRDNSEQCYNNNLTLAEDVLLIGNCSNNTLFGKSIRILVPTNNLFGELENVCIHENTIGLNNETLKTTIKYNDKYHIDYLDYETLTHQFYEIPDSVYSS